MLHTSNTSPLHPLNSICTLESHAFSNYPFILDPEGFIPTKMNCGETENKNYIFFRKPNKGDCNVERRSQKGEASKGRHCSQEAQLKGRGYGGI
jgi:hypothetical protein